jgi:CubicO group peptidase (beta-lactamase class C family)
MENPSYPIDPQLAELDQLMASAFPSGAPGAAVIVQKGGQILMRKGYGMANIEWSLPAAPDTVFRSGSVTKQFTAVSILMLVEQGKLDLQDPLEKFSPGYPTQGHTITVEHLLTHTSGIQSYTSMKEWQSAWGKEFKLDELIDFFKSQPMGFAPGKKWSYNNSAYVLLGAVIEKAAGLPYDQFLEKNIFEPLGMKQTCLELPGRIIPKRAAGYQKKGETIANAAYISMTQPLGAGGMVSTVDDLACWDSALYGGKLVSAEQLRRAHTRLRLSDGSTEDYGYGWGIHEYQGIEMIEHGGGIHGFSCHIMRVPTQKIFAAVLTNSENPAKNPSELTFHAVTTLLGMPLRVPPTIQLDQSSLAALVGVYQIEEGPEIHITAAPDGLAWKIAGEPDYDSLVPLSETEFINPQMLLLHINFLKEGDGLCTGLEAKDQYGKTVIKASRTSNTLP